MPLLSADLINKSNVLIACCSLFALLFVSCITTPQKPQISDVDKADAHTRFGHSYLQSKDLKKAFVEFQQAIKLDPRNKYALNAIGLIYASPEFGEYETSVKYLKRSISVDPNYSDAFNHLGVAYLSMGNYDEAIKYFKRALENPLYLNPESALSNMGYAYFKKDDYLASIKTLKEAISEYSDFPRSYYTLGLVYLKMGKIDNVFFGEN